MMKSLQNLKLNRNSTEQKIFAELLTWISSCNGTL